MAWELIDTEFKSHPLTCQTGGKNLWRVKVEYRPGQEKTYVTGKKSVSLFGQKYIC